MSPEGDDKFHNAFLVVLAPAAGIDDLQVNPLRIFRQVPGGGRVEVGAMIGVQAFL